MSGLLLRSMCFVSICQSSLFGRVLSFARISQQITQRGRGSSWSPFHGTSEEIFETLDVYVKSKELDWRNCVGICMGGARAMCCKNSGVVTRVLNQSPNASWTHCSIHREVLALKTISDDLKNVLNTAVKIINFIKSKPLQSRLFEKLCKEMGSCHKSLLFHSEVRWLSRGNMLTRLVELREEVAVYL
ncbi:Zinc finger BED domain-containing protein 5 [Trichinella nelsoni]|uniref:Zinc finger BED domain-containing protein 5 n=1 Tax=Trichinella nelsoni TaxID=6336 RepID=A0A0V0SG55_9BILA|nr:Zinc finger BED domain-containing protein 5 [Trichinella nelsoni]